MKHVALMIGMTLAAGCVSVVVANDPPTTRRVQITVNVRDRNNAAMPGLCLAASYANKSHPKIATQMFVACAKTSLNGVAVLDLEVPVMATRAIVLPAPVSTCCLAQQSETKFLELHEQNSAEPWYAVPLSTTSNSATLEIRAESAFAARAQVPVVKGDRVFIDAQVLFHHALSIVDSFTGKVLAKGLPRGRTSYLVASPRTSRWTVFTITPPAESESEVDLGTLQLLPEEAGVDFSLTVLNAADIRYQLAPISNGVTLVDATAARVYSFNVADDGKVYPRRGAVTAIPKVPAGDYFVAPGLPGGMNRVASNLVRLAKEGQSAVLVSAGVPVIQVNPDGTTQATVDVAAAELAIAKAAGTP